MKRLIIVLVSLFVFSISAQAQMGGQQTTTDASHMNDQGKDMNNTTVEDNNTVDHGYAICPVCRMKTKITKDTPWVVYKGKKYYFDDEGMKKEFLKDPEKYINDIPAKEGQQKPESH